MRHCFDLLDIGHAVQIKRAKHLDTRVKAVIKAAQVGQFWYGRWRQDKIAGQHARNERLRDDPLDAIEAGGGVPDNGLGLSQAGKGIGDDLNVMILGAGWLTANKGRCPDIRMPTVDARRQLADIKRNLPGWAIRIPQAWLDDLAAGLDKLEQYLLHDSVGLRIDAKLDKIINAVHVETMRLILDLRRKYLTAVDHILARGKGCA